MLQDHWHLLLLLLLLPRLAGCSTLHEHVLCMWLLSLLVCVVVDVLRLLLLMLLLLFVLGQ